MAKTFPLFVHASILSCLLSCGSESAPRDPCDLGTTAAELMPCVEEARLSADIEVIAKERISGSAHWQVVQDLCRTRLEEYGYEVALEDYGTGINVIGRREGSDPAGGDVIVSGHYDSIEDGCPAASDNAAGVAATLEMARLLASKTHQNSLVVACWDEEERGLIGSKAYADAAKAANHKIEAMISFDPIGFFASEANTQTLPSGFQSLFPGAYSQVESNEFRGDFVSLVADTSSSAAVDFYLEHAATVGLKAYAAVVPENFKNSLSTGDLRRSDHASFWAHDYPGIHVNDTANFRNPNYHCMDGMDSPSTLTMSFVTQITQAALGTTIDLLVLAPSE